MCVQACIVGRLKSGFERVERIYKQVDGEGCNCASLVVVLALCGVELHGPCDAYNENVAVSVTGHVCEKESMKQNKSWWLDQICMWSID